MITERCSIIIGDRNQHHHVLEKAITIIKEKFKGQFTVNDLIALDSFAAEEKEHLRNIFLDDITGVDAWEHSFYRDNSNRQIWKYGESFYDYKQDIRHLLMLLNTSETSIGEIVDTSDYRFVETIWHDWLNLLDYETRWVLYEYHHFDEKEFIEFICHNLKSRIGDSCIFNFEFLKTFMEAKRDYHAKKILEAILGKEAQS